MYSILDEEVPIKRLIDESKEYYVIVPSNPHLFGHILIVLKKHCENLMSVELKDLNILNEAVKKWSLIFSKAFDDCTRVYLACLNDEGHLHYHLFPIRDKEKPDKEGHALKWLGNLEECTDKKPFEMSSKAEKIARGEYIKEMVLFFKKQKKKYRF